MNRAVVLKFDLVDSVFIQSSSKEISNHLNLLCKEYIFILRSHIICHMSYMIDSFMRRTWGLAVLMFFFDAVHKISVCGVAVISNLTVCDVCVFHAAVFGEMKLFAMLWFLVRLGDTVFVNFFGDVAVFRTSPCPPPLSCLLYTSPSPRDLSTSRMPSSA